MSANQQSKKGELPKQTLSAKYFHFLNNLLVVGVPLARPMVLGALELPGRSKYLARHRGIGKVKSIMMT